MNRPDWIAIEARKECNVCGGPVVWLSDRSELDGVPEIDEVEKMLGGIDCAWRCEACGEIGVFGQSSPLLRYG